MILFLMKLQH